MPEFISVHVSQLVPVLQTLDATEHVQVTGGVLLDHILHIVWTQRLLELLFGHMELHDPAGDQEMFTKWPHGGALTQHR